MTIEIVRGILGWCIVINLGILLFWWLCLMFAHDGVFKFHSKWFKLSMERFDEIHYQGIAIYKIAIFMANISPYFALRIIG